MNYLKEPNGRLAINSRLLARYSAAVTRVNSSIGTATESGSKPRTLVNQSAERTLPVVRANSTARTIRDCMSLITALKNQTVIDKIPFV